MPNLSSSTSTLPSSATSGAATSTTASGAETPAASHREPTTILCRNPANGELLGEVPAMDAAEVGRRLQRARAAQLAWARTSFAERRRVLRCLLDTILDRVDELCRMISAEAGKTLQNAIMGEIFPVCEKLRYTIKTGERDLAPEHVSSGLLVHKRATIEYHPLGVIGIISPWNFPFQNILGPTIPSLFAGNAVLCKVSEWSSYSAPYVQKMFDEVLTRCGHSPDLVHILTGYGSTGAALVRSGVDKIIFTGSVHNGRRVVEGSSENLTPVILELGGKDPLIVCDDADLDQAVAGALSGVFIAAGQMCLAAERVYVMDGIYDRFVSAVTAEVSALRQGDPLQADPLQADARPGGPYMPAAVDVGAMTMPGQVDIVERLVSDALARGATALVGGRRDRSRSGGGQFFPPTVLTGVTHDMEILKNECFGPVMCILRVRDDDDAIHQANDSGFGLGSTVFSKDHKRARRIADRLVAGSTCINDYGLCYMANALPFGGVKQSGFGRLNGREGLRACCNIKSVLSDRFPLHLPAKIYPVRQGDYETVRATVELLYRRANLSGLRARARSLGALLRPLLPHR